MFRRYKPSWSPTLSIKSMGLVIFNFNTIAQTSGKYMKIRSFVLAILN